MATKWLKKRKPLRDCSLEDYEDCQEDFGEDDPRCSGLDEEKGLICTDPEEEIGLTSIRTCK